MASILIVDDDQQIVRLLDALLKEAGHKTLSAYNGAEALKVYLAERPELVLTDIIMPEKEGLETIRELKEINPDIKLVAISGGGYGKPSTYLKLAQKLGATETLEKPFCREDLLASVEKALAS